MESICNWQYSCFSLNGWLSLVKDVAGDDAEADWIYRTASGGGTCSASDTRMNKHVAESTNNKCEDVFLRAREIEQACLMPVKKRGEEINCITRRNWMQRDKRMERDKTDWEFAFQFESGNHWDLHFVILCLKQHKKLQKMIGYLTLLKMIPKIFKLR